jgi:nicotinamide-nucleotide amidase
MDNLVQEIGELLKKHNLTVGTVESATGGLISHLITCVSGSSDYYKGSIVSYSNEVKMTMVGVKKDSLEKYGAVSAQVCTEMAEGGKKVLGVDICLADTGIAGPTGATPGKPIGLFYIGISHKNGSFNRKYLLKGDREKNKEQAAIAALNWLKDYLTGLDKNNITSSELVIKPIVTCFIESENKILIMRRSGRVGKYQGLWAGISGFIEKNTPEEQAYIEIKEETGLDIKDLKLIKSGKTLEILDDKLKIKWLVHPFLFYIRYLDKLKLDSEHVESRWITPEDVESFNTVPKLKETLETVLTWRKLDA